MGKQMSHDSVELTGEHQNSVVSRDVYAANPCVDPQKVMASRHTTPSVVAIIQVPCERPWSWQVEQAAIGGWMT